MNDKFSHTYGNRAAGSRTIKKGGVIKWDGRTFIDERLVNLAGERVDVYFEGRCTFSDGPIRIVGCYGGDVIIEKSEEQKQLELDRAVLDGMIKKIQVDEEQKDNTSNTARALSLICLLFLGAAFASCSSQVERKGYPVVNEYATLSEGKPWLLTGTSISETAEDLAAGQWRIDSADLKGGHTHFYYAKGDSTRHIVTYQGRIVSDERAVN